MTTSQEFINRIDTFSRAAIPVIFVRTNEMARAVDCLRELASHRNKPFWHWSITKGLHNITGKPISLDINTADFIPALTAMAGKVKNDGLVVYESAHGHFLDGNGVKPRVSQEIRDIAAIGGSNKIRVVFLVHPEFTVPSELENISVTVDMGLPCRDERFQIVDSGLEKLNSFPNPTAGGAPLKLRPNYTAAQIETITGLLAGMTVDEAQHAVSRAMVENTKQASAPGGLPFENIVSVIGRIKTEVVSRTEALTVMKAEDINDVGGLINLKRWMAKRKRAFSKEAREFGVDAPKGIALVGPPGTGKSFSAKAIASELSLPLIRFDVSRVFNHLVGSSESRMRQVLKLVEAMAPCVLFIDEVDKALNNAHGSSGDSGVSSRILGELLTWMNDNKSGVFTVITANRVDNLPAEFLRKGRLDEVFSVTLPNGKDRESVMRIHLKKRKQNGDIPLDQAVAATRGYVPAELEAAVAAAVLEAFSEGTELTQELIISQLSRPMSETHSEQFARMRDWAETNAIPAADPEDEETISAPVMASVTTGLEF